MQHIWLSALLLVSTAALLAGAQGPYPPRLSIPGAVPVASTTATRPQFRNEKLVRVRRPIALRAQNHLPPRLIEEPKPVTEAAEEEDTLPDAFLPSLLREQQLAQAQQAQFQQAASAFLNGEANGLHDGLSLIPQEQHEQQQNIPPPRFQERPQPQPTPNSRPAFNDYGIGSSFGNGGQRYSPAPAPLPPQPTPQAQPPPQRFNVIRTRPTRPQYEAQAAPAPQPQQPPRPRPKPIQSRPIIEQNQLQQEERNSGDSQRRQRPVAQTLRKWREENEDGSITWGYENDDGSFKEELIGTDCITKGTYGYIDPDGNKREYHYETGIKCDPNARQTDEDYEQSGFINYEENKAVLPNGIEIDMTQLGKKKSKRPNYRN